MQMAFSRPALDLVRDRTSCRTYEKRILESETLGRIRQIVREVRPGPFGSSIRLLLSASAEGDEQALRGLGTYGVIRNPAGFVIGAVRPGERSLVDYGYCLETIVLYLEDLGLGSCWLGGSFRKSRFAETIACTIDEYVPAVLSLGYSKNRRSLIDRLIRTGAGSDHRKPWSELFFSDFFTNPLAETDAGPYAICLEAVRLGPSASNRQPWRIVRESGNAVFHFYLARSPGYAERSEQRGMADLQQVDIGIAACHFESTAKEAGLPGRWSVGDPDLRDLPGSMEYIVTWIPSRL